MEVQEILRQEAELPPKLPPYTREKMKPNAGIQTLAALSRHFFIDRHFHGSRMFSLQNQKSNKDGCS
jgi:hypothetical protein